jgi:hypothetical protein
MKVLILFLTFLGLFCHGSQQGEVIKETYQLFSTFSILAQLDPPTVPEAEWELMSGGGGLRAKVPKVDGMTKVELHFNINKELSGVGASDYFFMIE